MNAIKESNGNVSVLPLARLSACLGRRFTVAGIPPHLWRKHVPHRTAASRTTNANGCSKPWTAAVSPTRRRRKSRPRCWTREPIIARPERCTASFRTIARCARDGTSCDILPFRSRSCWPPLPTRSGLGTSPNSADPPSGPTSTSTSSSTSSAATSSDGCWPQVRAPLSPIGSSTSPAESNKSLPAS